MENFLLPWWAWCLCTSVLFAAFLWVNAHYKLAAEKLILMRSVVCVAGLTPFIFFVHFPTEPLFYAWVLGAALSGYWFDIIAYRVVAEVGGAVVSRLLPLRIIAAFAIWAALQPSYLSHLFEESWRGYTVIFSLMGCTVALLFLSRCPVSWPALRALSPAIIMLALTDICSKMALVYVPNDVGVAVVLYPMIVSATMIPLALARSYRLKVPLPDKQMWRTAGIVAGGLFLMQIGTKGLALRVTPDPSYFTAINMLSAVWLYLYHRYAKIPDNSNILAGAMFIGFVLLLVLSAPAVKH